MGQDCSACLRGMPASMKNMKDMDLSKKVVEPLKEAFKRTIPRSNSEKDLFLQTKQTKLLSSQPNDEPSYTQNEPVIFDPIEVQKSEKFQTLKEPRPKFKNFFGNLSKKLAKKAKEVDEKIAVIEFENELPEPVILEDGTIFSGEFDENDNKTGKGLEIRKDGSKFVGSFKQNLREGKGRLIYANGDYYEGSFHKGKADGKGKLITYEGVIYEGYFKNDKKNGFGKETWLDGSVYEGFFEEDYKTGHGKFLWKDGSVYEGEFCEDKIEGKGIYKWANGKCFDGEWKDNKINGEGVFTWPSGRKYEGQYKNDLKDGNGKFTWPDGRVYDGQWKEGQQEGVAMYTFYNKKTKNFQTRKSRWEKGTRIEWIKE